MNAPKREQGGSSGFARARRIIGALLGVLLFVAAIGAVMMNREPLAQAWTLGTSDRWPLLLLAAVLPLANWVVTSGALWALLRPWRGEEGRVGFIEMMQLVGVAGLANYLPMRPGMIGRVTYHKVVNGISVGRAIRATIAKLVLSAVSIVVIVCVGLFAAEWGIATIWGIALIVLVPVGGLFISAGAMGRAGGATRVSNLVLGLAFSLLDMVIWMARYAATFALVGAPLNAPQAAAVTGVSQAAMVVPLTGNGLGLREWAVGLTGPLLPESLTGAAPVSQPAALSADVLNRGLEVIVAVALGMVCSALIAANLRKRGIDPARVRDQARGTGDDQTP